MTALPLVFDAPRRGKPPRHLADLDEAGREQLLEGLVNAVYRLGAGFGPR
jgi:23S rRNA (adenine2503-C2)-methyltransferase